MLRTFFHYKFLTKFQPAATLSSTSRLPAKRCLDAEEAIPQRSIMPTVRVLSIPQPGLRRTYIPTT